LDGNIAQNVFNAVVTGGGSPWADADVVADALEWVEDMYAHIVTSLSDEIDGSQVQVYLYDSVDDDWDEVGTTAWVFNPSGATDQLPRGVAALINAKTQDPDVQGKKYVPGFTESSVADGLYTAGVITILGDFADEWLTGFVGGTSAADWQPGVWSVVDTVFRFATGVSIIPTIPAYQRRRKRGVGV
jgi:hypothetical protein